MEIEAVPAEQTVQPSATAASQEVYRAVPPRPEPPPASVAEPRPVNPLQAPLQHAPQRRVASAPNYAPPQKPPISIWLLLPLFTFAFIGLGAALYFGYQRFAGGKAGFTGGEIATAAAKPKGTNALQRYVEVVGIRLIQDAKKRPLAKFVAVNHGSTQLDDVTASVTLWASTSRSEEDSVGTFTFKINDLNANEAKEISTPLKTKLRMYELPDWQNLTAEVQITSP